MKITAKSLSGSFIILLVFLMCAGCDSREERMKALGDQGNIEELKKFLGHKEINTRLYAISLLAQTSHADALKPLLGCLQDKDPKIRNYAAYELGYLGSCGVVDKPTVIQLANILKDPDYVSRHDIITALGRSGLPDAIPPLVGMLQDKDETIRESAITALKCLAKESGFPCSQIGAAEVLSISNALDVAQLNGGIKSTAER